MPVLQCVDTINGATEAGTKAADARYKRLDRLELQGQIDRILEVAKHLEQLEPDQVMSICSANLAYLTEMYIRILRVEVFQRELKQIRTQEVVMCLELLRDQYKCASRLITVRGQDVELSR